MDSLTTQLLHSDQELGCPRCEYSIWTLVSEVVAQTAVTCPCCRTRVWLGDTDGSVQNIGNVVEQHINHALKGLWK